MENREFTTNEFYRKVNEECNNCEPISGPIFCQTLDSFYHFERKVNEIVDERPEIRKMDLDALINYIAILEPDLADVVEDAFTEHAIDGKVFLKLRESDLDSLGIEKYSDRIILREIIGKSKRLEKQRRRSLRQKQKQSYRMSLNFWEGKEGQRARPGQALEECREETILENKASPDKNILSRSQKGLFAKVKNGSGSKGPNKSRKRRESGEKRSRQLCEHTLEKNSECCCEECSMLDCKLCLDLGKHGKCTCVQSSPSQCLFRKSISRHQSLEDETEDRFFNFNTNGRQRSISFHDLESISRNRRQSSENEAEEEKSLTLASASMRPHIDSAKHSFHFRESSSSSSSQDFDEGSEASEYYYLNRKDKSLRLKLDTTGKLKKFEIAKEDLDIDSLFEFIGQGEYGKVYKTRLYSSTDVAVKIFDKKKIKNQKIKDVIEEAELLLSIRFPNIIMCMGWCMHYRQLMLVFEYMSQGSLYKVLHLDRTPLPILVKLEILRKISSGMEHLHSREILHCDLKTSNILLADDFRSVKVCDFGMSFLKSKLKKKNKWNSLSHYSAPEILRGEKFENAADVYSFGMIIWEMLTGSQPYSDIPKSHLVGIVGYDNNHQLNLPDSQVECRRLYELMLDTLQVHPRLRPRFKDISKRLDLIIQNRRRADRHRNNLKDLFSCEESSNGGYV